MRTRTTIALTGLGLLLFPLACSSGTAGKSALLRVTTENAGKKCVFGGSKIESGIDENGSKKLDDSEVTETSYLCSNASGGVGENGKDGADGKDGSDGTNGTNGTDGEDGSDGTNGTNGTDGADGEDGTNGTDGEDGKNSAVAISEEPAGENCAYGGKKIEAGFDTNADGTIDQLTDTAYVCAAAPVSSGIELAFLGRYQALNGSTPAYNVSGAEIPSFDPLSARAFVVNALAGGVDVLDLADPSAPSLVQFLDVATLVETAHSLAANSLGAANSVSIHEGVAAIAIEAAPKTGAGYVAFVECDTLALLGSVQVGSLPDMLTFTHDGKKVVVANEAEPADNWAVDPDGSVSIIDVSSGYAAPTVSTATFTAWNVGGAKESEVATLKTQGLRAGTVTGASPTFAADMEPEYLTISKDNSKAFVTLQENNAIATVDLATATVTKISPLGLKDHSRVGNELDVSDNEGLLNIRTWSGVYGAYMPDTIASYEAFGEEYLVIANEGDAREWPSGSYADVARASTLGTFTGVLTGQEANLGRLNILKDLSTTSKLVAFGGRSFSILNATTGRFVYDSGSDFEKTVALRYPANFNATHTANTFDNRSDDKGPEPDGVALGVVGSSIYAFIGLERIGGVMIYDVTNPESPRFSSYRLDRNFAQAPGAGTGGDLGPEGLVFVKAEDSPTGNPLLIVGSEISGTTTIYEVRTSN